VAVLAFHGTDDRVVPYDGAGTALPSIETWAAAWAERNGCDGGAMTDRVAEDVRSLVWQGCPEDGEVELVVVEGGGHGWPGTADPRRREATTDSIDATARLWEFFQAHARG
jgi:polyhydroxybutyrate depolymerase